MGAINSSNYYRGYPKSPPSCSQCPPNQSPNAEHGFIGLPTNVTCQRFFGPNGCIPTVDGYENFAFIFLLIIWLTTLLTTCFWSWKRRRLSRQILRTTTDGRNISALKSNRGGIDNKTFNVIQSPELTTRVVITQQQENNRKIIELQYFRSSKAEKVAMFLLLFNGGVLLLYYFILTFDFYVNCEFTGSLDNACFFGTFKVFGNYELNAQYFFVVWVAICLYSLLISFFLKSVFDWVSVPCEAEFATKVKVWVNEPTQVLSSGRPSFGARLGRAIERISKRSLYLFGKCLGFTESDDEIWYSSLSGTIRSVMVPIEATMGGRRYFVFECVRYDVPSGEKVSLSLPNPTIQHIRQLRSFCGYEKLKRMDLLDQCGKNTIPLTLPSIKQFLLEEFAQPFYAYQITLYLIWIWWTYWFVGLLLLLVGIFSGIWSVYLKRNNMKKVYSLASHHDKVEVLTREGDWQFLPNAQDLVVGDVVKISASSQEEGMKKWTIPADLVITDGSCAVDESGLTGESMPRSKTMISTSKQDEHIYVSASDNRLKSHILFAGTTVLEASKDCVGVVLSVGSDATRGQLLSHVLFPIETKFRFDEEFAVAVGLMFCYGLVAFAIAISFQYSNGATATWPTILSYGIFTISQVLSPMLKLALVAGRVSATKRLKEKGILCVDPKRIDIAGKVRVFCFDKTGTLTKEGLSFLGFVPARQQQQHETGYSFEILKGFAAEHAEACRAAATCHSIGIFNGQLLGSSVDVSMFEAAGGWTIGNQANEFVNQNTDSRLFVRRRMQFDQDLRLMSVIVEEESTKMLSLFVKGAPEAIAQRCTTKFTPELVKESSRLAAEGCYVLALAKRIISKQELHVDRAMLEHDLQLLGLLVFRNELKSDAPFAIRELKAGSIRCVMITGDNAPCGIFIAKQAGLVVNGKKLAIGHMSSNESMMIDWIDESDGRRLWQTSQEMLSDGTSKEYELVLTGDVFQILLESGEIYRILLRIRVFARMSPHQKVQVIHCFMEGPEGVVCAMAGDGGNDSGALRSAHVGLSMSAAEASIVAPFSSSKETVYSCVQLIIEGRAALSTSLASYKFVIVYGLLFSLFKMISFYYAILIPLLSYIMMDVVALVPLTFFITLSKPLNYLGPKRPTSSLLGVQTVSSVIGLMIISLISVSINFSVMANDTDYVRWPAARANTAAWWFLSDNWESTVLFTTCFFLFIISSFAFSFGAGHRQNVFTNYLLVFYVLSLFLLVSLALLLPPNELSVQFHFASEQFNRPDSENPIWQRHQKEGYLPSPAMDSTLRLLLWILTVGAMIAICIWERFVVHGPAGRWIKKIYLRGRRPYKEFDSF